MGIIATTKKEKASQFISYDELVNLVANIESCSPSEASEWLTINTNIIEHQLILERYGEFKLIEYQPLDHNGEYASPSESLSRAIFDRYVKKDFNSYEYLSNLGFARKKALYSLSEYGLMIEQSLFDESSSYIPEHKDNLVSDSGENKAHSVYPAEQQRATEQEVIKLKIQTIKNTPDLSEQKKLQAQNDQLQARIAELESEKKQHLENKKAILDDKIIIKDSDLLLISVLMQMLQSEIKVKANKSQAKILQKIEDENKNLIGLSVSRTSKIFSQANRLYNSLKNK